ncbi:porin, partial [uncultured Caballeronia sp.]|uniref:porin n=1 Tax=uncultured Caballeronia sp. TaxID=1827198 RepID=UPI0035C95AB1
LATVATRAGFLLVSPRIGLPARVERALRYAPACALAAIIAPEIFVLESGFHLGNGRLAQGGAEFGRQAFVGLSSNEGTLTLGRQYDPLLEALQPFSAAGTWAGSMSSPVSDVNNFVSADRANNAIKYASPIWGGFRVSGLYSVGGVAGNLSQNQIWALAATYSRGPLSLAAGYINARDPNVSFYGNTPNKGLATANNIGSFGSATTPETAPGYAGYASAKTREMAGVAAAYTFAQTTVSVIGANTRFESLGSNSGPNPLGYHGSTSFNTAELNVRQRFTPSLLAGAAFDYTRRTSVNADGGATYLQLDLGLDYSLSIRTDVYWIVDLQRAMGRDSLGQSAVADINGFTPSSTDKQVALRVAIKHRF